jgi:hypothetical protein
MIAERFLMNFQDTDHDFLDAFSSAAKALKAISPDGIPHNAFGGIARLRLLLQEMGVATPSDMPHSSLVAIIDEVVRTYLQAQPTGDLKTRVIWLEKKAGEACGYLQFLGARKSFVKASEDYALAAVVARIQGEAVEVEAGKYSLRDIRNVVPLIADKMNVYREEHPITAE